MSGYIKGLLLEKELDTLHGREGFCQRVGPLGLIEKLLEQGVDLEMMLCLEGVLKKDEAQVGVLSEHGISVEVFFLIVLLQAEDFLFCLFLIPER